MATLFIKQDKLTNIINNKKATIMKTNIKSNDFLVKIYVFIW